MLGISLIGGGVFGVDRKIVDLLISWSMGVGRSVAIPEGDSCLRIFSGNGEVGSTFWGNVGFRSLESDKDYKAERVQSALDKTDHVFILDNRECWIYLAKENLLGRLAVWQQILLEEESKNNTS